MYVSCCLWCAAPPDASCVHVCAVRMRTSCVLVPMLLMCHSLNGIVRVFRLRIMRMYVRSRKRTHATHACTCPPRVPPGGVRVAKPNDTYRVFNFVYFHSYRHFNTMKYSVFNQSTLIFSHNNAKSNDIEWEIKQINCKAISQTIAMRWWKINTVKTIICPRQKVGNR